MKLGDLIKVRYINNNPYEGDDDFNENFIGVLVETPDCHIWGIYKMWCFKTESMHALMPARDMIEVLSESR